MSEENNTKITDEQFVNQKLSGDELYDMKFYTELQLRKDIHRIRNIAVFFCALAVVSAVAYVVYLITLLD